MEILLYIFIAIILVAIIWRFLSKRWMLPCPVWFSWLIEQDNPFTKTNHASVIIEQLDLKPGMKVLDAGCGPGRLTIPIAKQIGPAGEVMAVDIQSGMLNRVKEKAKAANLSNIKYLQAKLGHGELEYSRYDRAVLISVLGEIPHREKAMKEIFNALRPGGILAVTELIFDPHFQRSSVVSKLATKAGFEIKKTTGNFLAYTMLLEKP